MRTTVENEELLRRINGLVIRMRRFASGCTINNQRLGATSAPPIVIQKWIAELKAIETELKEDE